QEPAPPDSEAARTLLSKALRIHAQRGELPVLAAKLKKTMLLMDSAFNETNFGFAQFRNWLEDNGDLLQLYTKDFQVYVAPNGFTLPGNQDGLQPLTPAAYVEPEGVSDPSLASLDYGQGRLPLRVYYKQILNRLKMTGIDFSTRRDVLRDIYRELSARPGERTTDELLEELCNRYEVQGIIRSKTLLRQIWQMGFRQRAFDYHGEVASVHVPVWLAKDIDSEATFVQRAEAGFVYAVINAGLEIDREELSAILINDREHTEYVDALLEDLMARGLVIEADGRYSLPGSNTIPFIDEPALEPVIYDIQNAQPPENMPRTPDRARALAKTAMLQRSQDFAASARSYLYACRVQWDAVEAAEPTATLEDLRWYMASYASVKAGELSQIHRDYAHSRPYYLAFFYLVQEDDPLWGRMRGLINPMLSYYWVNAWRELGMTAGNPSLNGTTPAEIAVRAATHDDQELARLWFSMTTNLAAVNPGLIRRVANQIRLNRNEGPQYAQVADELEQMLME
ncbi:MAG: hypothetical protein DCC55_39205, partial [Chloroflexi bacterium]